MCRFCQLILNVPIIITFGNDTTIYTAEIVNKQPNNLSASISSEESIVALAPTLLNPKDSVMIRMLVTKSGSIKVDGRIAGVSKIQEVSHDKGTLTSLSNIALGVATGAGLLAAVLSIVQGSSLVNEWLAVAVFLPLVFIPMAILIGKMRS